MSEDTVETQPIGPGTGKASEARKIRVLRLFSRLNIGGPAIHVILATAGLDPKRYESRLVVGREEEREGSFFDLAEHKGIPIQVIPSFARRINPIGDVLTLVQLFRLMKRERPDVVHTHTAKAGALGRVAARLAGVPVVVHTFHGSVFEGYFGILGSHLIRLIEKALTHLSDAVVAVSPRVADELERKRIAPRKKIEVIYLGLELDRFQQVEKYQGELRRELGLAPNVPIIGAVGRLVPIKDLPTLLRAMRGVVERRPDAVLLIVGDGPERLNLEAEAHRLDLNPQVRFLGFRHDLERIYADLDIAVNSSCNEGTPVALIEALSAGVPVVATHVGGTPDLLDGGKLGKLVLPADSQALADALVGVLCHREEAQAAARAARREIVRRFRSDRLFADLDALYSRALSVRRLGLPCSL